MIVEHLHATEAAADLLLRVEEAADDVEVAQGAIRDRDHLNVEEDHTVEDVVAHLLRAEEDSGEDGREVTVDLVVVPPHHAEDDRIEITEVIEVIETTLIDGDHLQGMVGVVLQMIIVAVEEATTIEVEEMITDLLEEEAGTEVFMVLLP